MVNFKNRSFRVKAKNRNDISKIREGAYTQGRYVRSVKKLKKGGYSVLVGRSGGQLKRGRLKKSHY